MKKFATITLAGLTIALAACEGRTDEAPDIEDAIPVDQASDDAADNDMQASTNSSVEPTATERGSNTIESGSNPPEMTSPPPGSKVQRAD